MISSLKGIVDDISLGVVTLDVNGVGYEVLCTSACLACLEVGEVAKIITYTDVKEDSIRLYGFHDRMERQVFTLLLKVSGVGARTSADILSKMDKLELLRIIGAGDVARLQAIKGIGKKIAERIVVELKDRVAEFAEHGVEHTSAKQEEFSEPFQDALAALIALGFTRRDAERSLEAVRGQGARKPTGTGNIVREALKYI